MVLGDHCGRELGQLCEDEDVFWGQTVRDKGGCRPAVMGPHGDAEGCWSPSGEGRRLCKGLTSPLLQAGTALRAGQVTGVTKATGRGTSKHQDRVRGQPWLYSRELLAEDLG